MVHQNISAIGSKLHRLHSMEGVGKHNNATFEHDFDTIQYDVRWMHSNVKKNL